jgi:hypothetical protein
MMATIKLDGVRKLVLVVFALALTLSAVGCGTGADATDPDYGVTAIGFPVYSTGG